MKGREVSKVALIVACVGSPQRKPKKKNKEKQSLKLRRQGQEEKTSIIAWMPEGLLSFNQSILSPRTSKVEKEFFGKVGLCGRPGDPAVPSLSG